MRCFLLLTLGLAFVLANTATAEARTVTVWLLEIRVTPTDTWHTAGTYDSYASAQQSYTVRARHGGYTEMRIRQTTQWRPSITDPARIAPRRPFLWYDIAR